MDKGTITAWRCEIMEENILVLSDGVKKEIIGGSPHDCIDRAYKRFKGHRVELIWTLAHWVYRR
jgi:hypothetical protein